MHVIFKIKFTRNNETKRTESLKLKSKSIIHGDGSRLKFRFRVPVLGFGSSSFSIPPSLLPTTSDANFSPNRLHWISVRMKSTNLRIRVYPTSHLLSIHVSEAHDSFFQAKVAHGYPMVQNQMHSVHT